MSANLDLVRSIYADWERGDYGSADWAHPEIEYVWVDGLEPGSRTRLAGMAEGWRKWLSAWEEYRVEAEEDLVLEGERVLVLVATAGAARQADWRSSGDREQ